MKIGDKSRRGVHGPISLSMTSMIDATFLLLSYFIFTAAVGEHESHLSAAAAAARAGAGSSALSPQVVDVEADGANAVFRIGSHKVRSRDDLAAVLRRLPRDLGVVIRVHAGPNVAAVAAALQAAHDAGFSKVDYVAASH